jgi:biopolymer transport protein ExbD
MKSRKSLSAGDDTSEINISPMIDMVFILLIFFIVTTVFVEESGFGVDRPNPVAEPEEQDEDKESVKLTVDKNNQIFYNGEKIDRGSIRPKVSQVLQADKDAPVVVEAQDAALAGLVVMVMDEARLGGALVISLTSAPD